MVALVATLPVSCRNYRQQGSYSMSIKIPNVKVEHFDVIDSTNLEAKRRFSGVDGSFYSSLHKTLLVAEEQTAGRGRLGRRFYSPAKTGVYFSLIFVANAISTPSIITASAAVAVCRAISSVFTVSAKIKWVNDVFVDGKKVCGILTEGIENVKSGKIEAAIIGIGITILPNSNMPKSLENIVGKLCDFQLKETGDFEEWLSEKKNNLIQETVLQLLKILENPDEEFPLAMREYKDRSNLLGTTITFSPVIGDEKKNFQCTVLDITDDAKLVVQMNDGSKKTLESGEVTLHKDY